MAHGVHKIAPRENNDSEAPVSYPREIGTGRHGISIAP
jgi:hypothetical protein